jgi:hypothetical protein
MVYGICFHQAVRAFWYGTPPALPLGADAIDPLVTLPD